MTPLNDADWELIGDGSIDDPIRPDVFDDHSERNYYWDTDAGELFILD